MNEALVSDLSSMETIRDAEKCLRLLDQVLFIIYFDDIAKLLKLFFNLFRVFVRKILIHFFVIYKLFLVNIFFTVELSYCIK